MFLTTVTVFFILLTFNGNKAALEKNKKIFCFYDNFYFDYNGEGFLKVQNIKSEYCSHLIYGDVDIDVDGTIKSNNAQFDFGEDEEKGNIRLFNELKESNKNLKTLISIGGSRPELGYYSELFQIDEKQERFVESSIDFVVRHNFDGLVLNAIWTNKKDKGYVINPDKKNLISLLKKLKQETQRRNLILVVFIHGFASKLLNSYNIKEIAEIVDYIYIRTYNTYYGEHSSHIGIGGALYLHPRETDRDLSVDSAIKRLIILGAPPEKILMAIVIAGRSFTLEDVNKTEPGSPFIKGLPKKQYLSDKGDLTYMELCQKLSNESWTIKWEDAQKNPYAFKGNQWVGYENERSLEHKAKYVIKKKLAGVVIVDIEYDDFRGLCGEKYPLNRVLNTYLRPNDESKAEYIINVSVFKKNLNDLSTQCVYHTSKILPLE